MFDAPIEDWYVWLGVSIVSVAVLGVAVGLPTAAPPDAAAIADVVDRVGASPPGSTAIQRVRAEAIKLDRRRIAVRGRGGTAHATIAFGPMAPTAGDERLERVLSGEPACDVFGSPSGFGDAVDRGRNRAMSWRTAPETLRVRRVVWEGTDVLLVG